MDRKDTRSLFTEEDMASENYRFRNGKDMPKRIKFIAFCNFKPATDLDEYFHKRKVEDSQYCNRDVDFMYLREEFIDKFEIKDDKFLDQDEEQVSIHQNMKVGELWEEMEHMKKDQSLEKYDCFIFIFLSFISPANPSQGEETKIHFYDKMVALDEIWDRVSQIPSMFMKPKVFLVQADDVRLMQEPQMIMKAGPFKVVPQKIPTDADRLTIMSTIPGKYFVTGEKEPSFLIKAFVEAIKANETGNPPLDLLSLTVLMNQRVVQLIKNSKLQKTKKHANELPMPCTTSTLRKLLFI